MDTRWVQARTVSRWTLLLAAATAAAGCGMRGPASRTGDAGTEGFVTLRGIAQWNAPVTELTGAMLSLRLVDMTAEDPGDALVGAARVFVPRGASAMNWQVRIAADQRPRVRDAVLLATVEERGETRWVAASPARRWQFPAGGTSASVETPYFVVLRTPVGSSTDVPGS